MHKIKWCILLDILLLAGCQMQNYSKPLPKPASDTSDYVLTQSEMDIYVMLKDGTLERANSEKISGDTRPIWNVSGRITNIYGSDIKSATIRILAYDDKTGEQLDTAEFQVTDIPAGMTRAFRREVQLLISSPNRSSFNLDAISVIAKAKMKNVN